MSFIAFFGNAQKVKTSMKMVSSYYMYYPPQYLSKEYTYYKPQISADNSKMKYYVDGEEVAEIAFTDLRNDKIKSDAETYDKSFANLTIDRKLEYQPLRVFVEMGDVVVSQQVAVDPNFTPNPQYPDLGKYRNKFTAQYTNRFIIKDVNKDIVIKDTVVTYNDEIYYNIAEEIRFLGYDLKTYVDNRYKTPELAKAEVKQMFQKSAAGNAYAYYEKNMGLGNFSLYSVSSLYGIALQKKSEVGIYIFKYDKNPDFVAYNAYANTLLETLKKIEDDGYKSNSLKAADLNVLSDLSKKIEEAMQKYQLSDKVGVQVLRPLALNKFYAELFAQDYAKASKTYHYLLENKFLNSYMADAYTFVDKMLKNQQKFEQGKANFSPTYQAFLEKTIIK